MNNKQHSKIKHEILRRYLYICQQVHKNKPSQYFYLDTNAGDGVAIYGNETKMGSPLIAIKKDAKCVFIEKDLGKFRKLQILLKDEKNVIKIILGDCNEKIKDALKHIIKWCHSICFVDPYNVRELDWKTVQTIVEWSYTYANGNVRRPELIINFPINAIWRTAGLYAKKEKPKYAALNSYFGDNDWQKLLSKENLKQEDFLNYYIGKLKPYYKFHFAYLIKAIKTNTPLYYLIFFYNHTLADKVIRDFMADVESWVKSAYIRDYYKVEALFPEIKPPKLKVQHKTIEIDEAKQTKLKNF